MLLSRLLAAAAAVRSAAAAIGFATYKEIREGFDNSGEIAYSALDRSSTLFLYIQIIAGQDHAALIDDFETLARNYGENGVAVIPRVRYGSSSGDVVAEPEDRDLILGDVALWTDVFAGVVGTIDIPLIQAGFLGLWGEWHSGPFCPAHGVNDSPENLDVKRAIVETLQGAGPKVVLRYPQDHQAIFEGDRAVTLHNDCIFDGGPTGHDGGTFFPLEERQNWVDYTLEVAGGNTYGGEGCSVDGGYDWWDYDDLCGSNGLAAYIDTLQIAYLNPGNPEAFRDLFNNPPAAYAACVEDIEASLLRYT